MSRDITIVLKAVDQYSAALDGFNTKVGNIATSSSQLKDEGGKAAGAMADFGNKLQGAIVAFAGWKGAQLVGDLIDMGQKGNIASETFANLTKDIGGSEENMRALRNATGGVVDNLTLMTSGNKLLQMGLATSTDELSKMTEIAIKLGSSMGMDATKAMSDFSLMLANNSIMRLDQFGISSGEVRKRIIELQAATDGLSRSDAFKMAVMEIGVQALERLGSAADAAETPVNRIVTEVRNLAQSFAGDFSTGLNSTIGILELLAGQSPIQQQQAQDKSKAEQDATAVATVYAQRYHEALGSEFKSLGTADSLLKHAMALTQLNPEMSNADAVEKALYTMPVMDKANASYEEIQQIQQVAYAMLEQKDAAEGTAKALADQAAAQAEAAIQAQMYADLLAQPDDRQASLAQQREGLELAKQHHDAMMLYNTDIQTIGNQLMTITGENDPMSSMYTSKLTSSQVEGMLPQFMDADAVNEVTRAFSEAEDNLTQLQLLADQDLISKEQLTQAENMTSNLGLMADQATKAGDAFKNLSLNTALGQTSGGMQGEMTDLVMKNMKDSGATEAQMAAMQAELDKTSGRETASSEELKSKVVPMIAKMSAEQAAKAMVNLDAMFKEAALQGLSQEQIAGMMPDIAQKAANGIDMSQNMPQYIGMMTGQNDLIGGQGGAGSIHDDEKSMNTRGKKGGTNPISDMSKSADELKNSTATIDKNMSAVANSTGLASKAADKLKDAIDGIASVKKITFAFDASDPSGILGLIKQLMGGTGLGDIVRANGGSVPGATGGGRTAQATAD